MSKFKTTFEVVMEHDRMSAVELNSIVKELNFCIKEHSILLENIETAEVHSIEIVLCSTDKVKS